ncbi:MAG: alpha/beta hydrolase-fold protein [Isosphaeraceae bacterium]|nr:alpha/beta hydrolase-fold protein [Isosphaeraceae bacterium]
MSRCLGALALILCCEPAPASPDDTAPLAFEVSYTPDVSPGPVSARVYVFLAEGHRPPREPRLGPDWFHPAPFFAVDAKDWKPGAPLRIDGHASGFPRSLSRLPAGPYSAQAVIRLNRDSHRIGDGEGNAFSPAVCGTLDARTGGIVSLKVNQVVSPRLFEETHRIKLVDIPSPLLSRFHGRPVRLRAAVLLPKGDRAGKLPSLYIIPGFGGDHHMARLFMRHEPLAFGKEFVRIVLDPDCATGHHAFADSALNGPRGRALLDELVPHIEAHFPVIPDADARFLTGHSSGGWSSLWLQVAYPESFAGAWSTSPDPVDFRDFSGIDLYAAGENMFRDRGGERRLIARRGSTPALFLDDFSKMEAVLGDGGQLGSFEAVFSPLDETGRPKRLWDRSTGAIDPDVASAWKAYDIRLILEQNWRTLGPKLKGKLHVYVGEKDTFFLEGAVRLLQASLVKLGSDAQVEIIPGKDHSTLLDKTFAGRLDRELSGAWSERQSGPTKP